MKGAGELQYNLEQIKAFVCIDSSGPEPVVTANPVCDEMLVWACFHFMPCVVGDKLFHHRSVRLDNNNLTKLGTASDIAFMLLVLQNNYIEWENFPDDKSCRSSNVEAGPGEQFHNLQLAVMNVKEARGGGINIQYQQLLTILERAKRPSPTVLEEPKAKRKTAV